MNSYMRAHYMQALSSSHTQTHAYMCMYLRSQDRILESRLHKKQKQQEQQQEHTTRSDRNAAAE